MGVSFFVICYFYEVSKLFDIFHIASPIPEHGGEPEERHEKPSSGRDSSTGDTSSGSDSSSDSSTSSISDAENGGRDMNDENPFQTPSGETLPEEPKKDLNVGRSPVEETGWYFTSIFLHCYFSSGKELLTRPA